MNLIDAAVMNWVHSIRTPLLTKLMIGISWIGSIYFFAILIILVFIYYRKLGAKFAISILIQSLIILPLKVIINRTRPNGLPYSFPSGHAGRWFTITFLTSKWYSLLSIILGILVSFSRVYLDAHYFTDVLVGSLIGLFASYLTKVYYDKIIEWLKKNEFIKDILNKLGV